MKVLVCWSTPKLSLRKTALGSTNGSGKRRVSREMMRADQVAAYSGRSEQQSSQV